MYFFVCVWTIPFKMAEKHLYRKCDNNDVLISVKEISCDLVENTNTVLTETLHKVKLGCFAACGRRSPSIFSPLFLFLASVLLLVEVNHGLAFVQSPPVPPPLFHRLFWYCLQAAINYPLTTILRKRRPLEFSPGSLPWTFFHRISRGLVKASILSPY